MITFSLRPRRRSTLPAIAASVSTRVVSWKLAAESQLAVLSAALIRPSSTVSAVAGLDGVTVLDPDPCAVRHRVLAAVLVDRADDDVLAHLQHRAGGPGLDDDLLAFARLAAGQLGAFLDGVALGDHRQDLLALQL